MKMQVLLKIARPSGKRGKMDYEIFEAVALLIFLWGLLRLLKRKKK